MPVPFGYLKSNVDNNKHEIKIVDCALLRMDSTSKELRRMLEELKPDVVGTSCWSMNYGEAQEINQKVLQND